MYVCPFLWSDGVVGLRITRVSVPSPVVVGEDGWLECEFVEEGENVYALKWYLGLEEFYRWTPAETPSVRTFPVRGKPMVVDGTVSSRGRVRFSDITLGATGVFRCEVSAEGPSFHTESEVSTMTVVGEWKSESNTRAYSTFPSSSILCRLLLITYFILYFLHLPSSVVHS